MPDATGDRADQASLAREQAAASPTRRRLPRPNIPRPDVSFLEGLWLVITVFEVPFLSALAILLAVLGKLSDAVVGVFERRALRRWA